MRKILYQREVKDLEAGEGWANTSQATLLSDIDIVTIPDDQLFNRNILKLEYAVGSCMLSANIEIIEFDNAYGLYVNGQMVSIAMKKVIE